MADAITHPLPPAPSQDEAPDTLTQCLDFLSHRDDTSRFVGLAMLSSVLNHVHDPAILRECWSALEPRFLDRLLNAGAKNKSPEEARDMIDLAVHVLNAFATSLPDAGDTATLVGRAPALIKVLPGSSNVTAATVLQTLLAFASTPAGAKIIVKIDDLSPLLQISVEHDTAIQVLQYAFVNTAASHPAVAKEQFRSFLPCVFMALDTQNRELRLRLLAFLGELLGRLTAEAFPEEGSWVKDAYGAMRTIITSSHAAAERSHCVLIIASFLHNYSQSHLFLSLDGKSSSPKPFLYLLLQLVAIDLRASFSSLLEKLASPSYTSLASRLAADFDIIAAFLGYLVTLDDSDFDTLVVSPDLLLQLRKDFAEVFSLTIEFLRDRWDAAYTGAPGLELGFEQHGPKQIAWTTTLPGGLERDPLIIGAVRALSLWLREDESLRKEAGGLMDLFLGLWEKGSDVGVDYRIWLIGALEGVLEERNGREMFLKLRGWELLWEDLKEQYMSDSPDVRLAVVEASILAQVVAVEGVANENWAKEVCRLADVKGRAELDAVLVRLGASCLAALHKAERNRLKEEVQRLRGVCERLVVEAQGEDKDRVLDIVLDTREELEAL